MTLLLTWVLQALALMIVAYILPGITVTSFVSALIAAVILGLVNAVVYPILAILTLPITIVTLGLFLLVLNVLMFWLAGSVFHGFKVDGFWWAVIGAVLYSIVSAILLSILN